MILCLKAEKYCNIRLLKFPFNIKKYWKHILSSSFFFCFFWLLDIQWSVCCICELLKFNQSHKESMFISKCCMKTDDVGTTATCLVAQQQLLLQLGGIFAKCIMPSKSPCFKRPGKAKSLFRDSRECGRCAGYLCDPAILVLVYASACPSVMHVNTLCELATAMHRQQYCIRKELIYVGENIFTNSLLCSIFKDWLSECSSSSLNITGLPDAA